MLSYQNEKIIIQDLFKMFRFIFKKQNFCRPINIWSGNERKIGQSLPYTSPILKTYIGIEGMSLTYNENVLIANNAEDFAQSILE